MATLIECYNNLKDILGPHYLEKGLTSIELGEIIKKSIVEVPFAFSMQIDSKCSIEANLQNFNFTEWNKAVEHNEILEKENSKLRD